MSKGPFPGGRPLLLAGFGGLLLLMLLAGADALLVLRQVRASSTQVRDAYVRRNRSLEQIRTGIYQSAIVIRDYLLAANAADAREQAQKWDMIRSSTEQALGETAAVLDSGESPLFRDLRAEGRAASIPFESGIETGHFGALISFLRSRSSSGLTLALRTQSLDPSSRDEQLVREP